MLETHDFTDDLDNGLLQLSPSFSLHDLRILLKNSLMETSPLSAE
jgi:hypothetical protein